jgi:CubicO group peptidase (beta-lactamase class C family)
MNRPYGIVLSVLLGAPSFAQIGLDNPGAIDAFLERQVAETPIPGVVAMAVDRDSIIYGSAFGARDVAGGRPMTMDTIFRIASMTKPITSAAVMMLVEEGKVALDDPIGRFFPEFRGKEVIDEFNPDDGSYTTRPATGEITIRHLMTHSSGLGYAFSSHVLQRLTRGESNASATDFPLLHDPGTRWSYGESTRVLGRLVEQVSGQALDTFMQERIFAPLGMTETSYRVPAYMMPRVATVHRLVDGEMVETPNEASIDPAQIQGDGGLNSTAADYAKFIQMLLNGGRASNGRQLLSAATVISMGENHMGDVRVSLQDAAAPQLAKQFPLGAGRDGFGLGFQVTGPPQESYSRAPGSMSWAGIFNTEFWIDPERGVGAVLLMQYLPFYDSDAIATLIGFEQRLYRELEESNR